MASDSNNLNELEIFLIKQMIAYGGEKLKIRSSAIKQLEEEKKQDKDALSLVKLKPLFKEWLEIRADASLKQNATAVMLENRCSTLIGYLNALEKEEANGISPHIKSFIVWLLDRVKKLKEQLIKGPLPLPIPVDPSKPEPHSSGSPSGSSSIEATNGTSNQSLPGTPSSNQ